MDSPMHKHDCSDCRFLGVMLAAGHIVDLYHCANNDEAIARRSSDPQDYRSMGVATLRMTRTLPLLPEYAEILRRLDMDKGTNAQSVTEADIKRVVDAAHALVKCHEERHADLLEAVRQLREETLAYRPQSVAMAGVAEGLRMSLALIDAGQSQKGNKS